MLITEGLGVRLRDARLALGLTQTQAAEGIVTGAFLSLIESGQRTPSPKVAAALAARLRVSLSEPTLADPVAAAVVAVQVALRLGDIETAESQLQGLSAHSPDRWLYEGLIAEQRGDLQLALKLLGSAADATALDSRQRLRAKVALCRCSRDAGDLFRSVEVGERTLAEASADPSADATLIAELRGTLAGTYCETGDLFRAHELTDSWRDSNESDAWTRATRRWARSMVLQTAGEYAEARVLVFEALDILESLDRPRATALLTDTAAWIAMQSATFDVAEVDFMLRDSERAFRATHAPLDLAVTLSSRAELAVRTNDAQGAVALIEEALHLSDGDDAGRRARLSAIAAQVYAAAGQVNRSMQLLLATRELLEDAGAKRSAAATWRHMAQTYEDLGELDLTVACLKAATDLLGLQPPLQTPVEAVVATVPVEPVEPVEPVVVPATVMQESEAAKR